MNLGYKILELRKQKNITQEELAAELGVTAAAVSKWESGRGYPSLDSLQAIAAYFSVTVDALLSPDSAVQETAKENEEEPRSHGNTRIRGLIFGLGDVSMALFLFLPLFASRREVGGAVRAVSLLSPDGLLPLPRIACLVAVICLILWGLLTLSSLLWKQSPWGKLICPVSTALGVLASLLFIATLQPYAAALGILLLAVKVFWGFKAT